MTRSPGWAQLPITSAPGGYTSHETEWMGMTSGQDSDGTRWTTSHWNGFDTTTVRRTPER